MGKGWLTKGLGALGAVSGASRVFGPSTEYYTPQELKQDPNRLGRMPQI